MSEASSTEDDVFLARFLLLRRRWKKNVKMAAKTSTIPDTAPTPIPAITPISCLVFLGLLLGVLLIVSVLVPCAAPLTLATLIVAKSRPAIVGKAAMGLIGQSELTEVAQEGVEKVDGGWVFVVTADHRPFKAS